GTGVSFETDQLIEELQMGQTHGCMELNHSIHCWGNNNKGQLGDGTSAPNNPQVLPLTYANGLDRYSTWALASGGNHNCVVSSGRVYCWGANDSGQHGTGDTQGSSVPRETGMKIAY